MLASQSSNPIVCFMWCCGGQRCVRVLRVCTFKVSLLSVVTFHFSCGAVSRSVDTLNEFTRVYPRNSLCDGKECYF